MEHVIVTKLPISRRLIRALPVIGAGIALAACAMNPADATTSTPERIAEAHQACGQTMGLNPANADYDMCVRSLLQTVASLDQASLVQRDRMACADRGLQPGTRDFALCVVDAETPAN
jgi:hypothetical protein